LEESRDKSLSLHLHSCLRQLFQYTISKRWLILILAFTILLRQSWLYTLVNRDEGGIAITALGWLNGLPPYTYFDNNAGPFACIIYAITTYLLGPDIISIRLLNNLLFYLSIILLFVLVKDLYGETVALSACLFYGIFMSTPIYEGQIALTSSLSTPFIVFSVYFGTKYYKNKDKKNLFLAGAMLSLAFLIKLLAIILAPLLLIIIVAGYFSRQKTLRRTKEIVCNVAVAAAGLVIIPTIFLIYFWKMNAIDDLVRVFLLQSLLRNIPNVPLGILFYVISEGLPLWIFGIYGVLTLGKAPPDIIVFTWLLLSVGGAAFPPNFGHRYIYLIAPLSILSGSSLSKVLKGLRDFEKETNRNDKKTLCYFTLCTLVLSSLVAFEFQKEQFPNYNINSRLIRLQWLYADANSYDDQVNLAKYFKSKSVQTGQILVHGWASEIYYLTGVMPPFKYVWSRPGVGIHIPPQEYDFLVNRIINYEFKYVVFYDYSISALRFRTDDPVVAETLRRYFFIRQIGNALIFGSISEDGYRISYEFLDNFAKALKIHKRPDGSAIQISEEISRGEVEELFLPRVTELDIAGEYRSTFLQVPLNLESQVIFSNITIPPSSILRFGIGIESWTWQRRGGDGAIFQIYVVTSDDKAHRIFEQYINPKQINEHRRWLDYTVDLSNYGGQTVQIIFVTTPGPLGDVFDDWAHWSRPLLLTKTR